MMLAATAHATIRHDASGLQAARAHVAPLLYNRAAPSAPGLYFLCAKQMTPMIIWLAAFGAALLIRSALSALDASCDCACYDQA